MQVEENHKKALQFTKRYYRDAKETMEMIADSLLNFSGAINPITVATMQMLVGDESLQFRFVNSKTDPVVVNHDISYNPSTKILNVPAGIIQHMTLGIKTLSNAHAAGDYKYWDMAEYNSPSLVNPEKKFYLYAKCSKDNQSGVFLLSETAIALEQIDGYYHLLVGILNSENNGERSFATLYGFTEILPGRITTDKIVSSDGKTYFDLVANEIAGHIRFLNGLISGLVGIGNDDGINAGMSGEGNSGSDVRIWAGANETNRGKAPFRVLHDGKLIGTDVDLSGIIHLNAEYLKISNGIDIDSGSLITKSAHLVLPEIEGDYSRVIRWVVPLFTRVIIQIRLETANSSVLIAPNGDALNPVSSFTINVGMDSGEIVGFKMGGYTYWSVFKHMHEEL